jgi:hypothetical protein
LYLWQLARDSSVDNYESIHDHFVGKTVGALTYNSKKSWLLGSAKCRLYITDMVKEMDVGGFIQVVQSPRSAKINKQSNNIVSISPNPVRQNLTIVG